MGWLWLWWLLVLLGVIALLVGLVTAARRTGWHGPTLLARRIRDERHGSGHVADDDDQARRREFDER